MLPRLAVAAAALFLCSAQSCFFFVSTGPTPAPNVVFILSSGAYVLAADRTWSVAPGAPDFPNHPSDPLDEVDYHANAGPRYAIVVGTGGQSVSIDASPPIRGTCTDHTDQQVTYSLTEGLFAGGRLVVWKVGSGYQGELTVYGSGVPIARSERGAVFANKGT